jgi:hypothetical protein
LTADLAAAILAAVVLSVLAMDRSVVDAGSLTWSAVAAELGPGSGGGDASLIPWLLLGFKMVVGDVLWAAKAMGVLAGTGAVVFATRMLGPWAGLWLLGQLGFLSAVVGADPALVGVCFLMAGLSLGARGRSVLAGVAAGLAVGVGPWAWPSVLAVVLSARSRLVVLGVLGGVCGLWSMLGVPIWPGVVMPAPTDILGVISRPALRDVAVLLGLAALLLTAIRDRAGTRPLLIFSLLGLVGAIFIPETPASMLHVQAGLTLGVAALMTGPMLLLVSVVSLGFRVPAALDQRPSERGRAQIIAAMTGRSGVAMCTTQTFVRSSDDGWLRPCVGLETLTMPPTAIHPADVLAGARRMGITWFAVEDRAILLTYPWLQDLLATPYPLGFELEAAAEGWRVFKLAR